MEKCGCMDCILLLHGKGTDIKGYIVEDCPCMNCLVKVVCISACDDIIDYVQLMKMEIIKGS